MKVLINRLALLLILGVFDDTKVLEIQGPSSIAPLNRSVGIANVL